VLNEDLQKSRSFPESDKIRLLKELQEAGQLNFVDGKYYINGNIKAFIRWCMNERYISEKKGDPDDVTPEFIFHNIEVDCTLETIKKYFREEKD
jgi:hypothetical protein